MEEPTNAAPPPDAPPATAVPIDPPTTVGVHDQAVANKGPIELPQYQSHKIVGALRITDVHPGATPDARPHLMYAPDGFNYVQPSPDVFARYTPEPGDYLVFYPDGYMSFSPKAAFEDGYAPLGDTITPQIAEPAADRLWSIKDGQTVTDANTGITIRFGSYGDASRSVFMQVAVAPDASEPEGTQARGSTLVFERKGEVHRILAHQQPTVPVLDAPGEQPPEPFQPNPGATSIGTRAGPAVALPANPVPPQGGAGALDNPSVPPVGMAPATVAAPAPQPPVMKPVQPLDGGA